MSVKVIEFSCTGKLAPDKNSTGKMYVLGTQSHARLGKESVRITGDEHDGREVVAEPTGDGT
jgi:hypothetical protein